MYYWACLFSFQNSEKTLTLTNRDGLHSRETMERRREDMQARGHADSALHLGGALELMMLMRQAQASGAMPGMKGGGGGGRGSPRP